MVPALIKDYDALPSSSPLKAKLAEPIAVLKGWDYKWGADSVANSVAIFWGDAIYKKDIAPMRAAGIRDDYVDYLTNKASSQDRLQALSDAVDKLTADFGTWKTPWGNINRYQRINDDIKSHFDDNAPSQPVPFDSAQWGSIASYATVHDQHQEMVRRRAATASSVRSSSDPRSRPGWRPWAAKAAIPNRRISPTRPTPTSRARCFRSIFYPDDYKAHAEETYHPGE